MYDVTYGKAHGYWTFAIAFCVTRIEGEDRHVRKGILMLFLLST